MAQKSTQGLFRDDNSNNLGSLTPQEFISKSASTFGISQEQAQKNFDKFQAARSTKGTNPQNVSGSSAPELASQNNNNFNKASNNIKSSTFNLDNFVNTLASGEATSQDITAGNAGMVQKILDGLKGTAGEAERRGELFEEEGVARQRELVQDYSNQLEAERRALDLSTRELFEGGLTKGQVAAQTQELRRVSLQKQADIAILGNAAIGNLNVAQQNINDRLELEFGPQKEQLDILMKSLEVVSGLSADVKRDIEAQAKLDRQAVEDMEANKKSLFDLAIKAQQAGNASLAQEFISMAQGDVTQETLDIATQQAISGGVFTPQGNGGGSQQFSIAEQFVAANPQMSNEELKSELLRDSDLTVSEINAIIDNRGLSTQDVNLLSKDIVFGAGGTFDKPSISRILPGDQMQSQLNNAKESARKQIDEDVQNGFYTQSEGELLKQAVENFTKDDIK